MLMTMTYGDWALRWAYEILWLGRKNRRKSSKWFNCTTLLKHAIILHIRMKLCRPRMIVNAWSAWECIAEPIFPCCTSESHFRKQSLIDPRERLIIKIIASPHHYQQELGPLWSSGKKRKLLNDRTVEIEPGTLLRHLRIRICTWEGRGSGGAVTRMLRGQTSCERSWEGLEKESLRSRLRDG